MRTKSIFAALLAAGVCIAGCDKTIPVESVALDKTEHTMAVGESFTLSATISPADADNPAVVWSSSNPSVATVDDNGTVKALVAGETTVKAAVDGKTAACAVTVIVPVESISLSESEYSLTIGGSFTLTATVSPADATDSKVEWTSSDAAVATVDGEGVVTALALGETEVTATAGGKTAACKVSVVVPVPAIGDYYYGDGSYSANLDPGKKVIGIVYWVGDPSSDDAMMRKDHPECTHGLVVCFDQYQESWQFRASGVAAWMESNLPDYVTIRAEKDGSNGNLLNKKLGYNNTKALLLFNEDPANSLNRSQSMDALLGFREEVPAPEGTSDWYLPSPKELSLLCLGEYDGDIYKISGQNEPVIAERLNEKLALVEDASLLEAMFYWSSTEYSNGSAYNMYFGNCNMSYSSKRNAAWYSRWILAF